MRTEEAAKRRQHSKAQINENQRVGGPDREHHVPGSDVLKTARRAHGGRTWGGREGPLRDRHQKIITVIITF